MKFDIIDLGLVDFGEAMASQNKFLNAVISGSLKSTLVICRHSPVITMGRQAKKENILFHKQDLPVYGVERGGDVTYHGPGQITAYPVFDLSSYKKDIHFFLRKLEETAISLLSGFGIEGARIQGKTGVWVKDRKICSVGISVRKWVTFHGLSLNVARNDLENFSLIRPCGMDIEMTSMESELGRPVSMEEARNNLINEFRNIFGVSADDDKSCLHFAEQSVISP